MYPRIKIRGSKLQIKPIYIIILNYHKWHSHSSRKPDEYTI